MLYKTQDAVLASWISIHRNCSNKHCPHLHHCFSLTGFLASPLSIGGFQEQARPPIRLRSHQIVLGFLGWEEVNNTSCECQKWCRQKLMYHLQPCTNLVFSLYGLHGLSWKLISSSWVSLSVTLSGPLIWHCWGNFCLHLRRLPSSIYWNLLG